VVGGAFNRVGSTTKVIASPALGDVVSFEIPEWSGRARGGGVGRGAMLAAGGRAVTASASNDSLGGHQFSVRLRLKAKG